MNLLRVSEVFGPTFQGEGPSAGRPAVFVRLGGCNLNCSWCFDADTTVLMADFTSKKITEVRDGDMVLSHRGRRFESAKVLHTMSRHSSDVVTVIGETKTWTCTSDHVFKIDHHSGPTQRRRSAARDLRGYALRTCKTERRVCERSDSWWRGWAKGLILGDGHVSAGRYPKVWLRVCDREIAVAYNALANREGAASTVVEAKRRTARGRIVYSVVHTLGRVPWLVDGPTTAEVPGFLAGFFDAEGWTNGKQLSMSQLDPKVLDRVEAMLVEYGFVPSRAEREVTINGREACADFMNLTQPILDRKTDRCFVPSALLGTERVVDVQPATPREVYNLTTTTGMFFANGALVEQCDTPYTWDWTRFDREQEVITWSDDRILTEVEERWEPIKHETGHDPHVVITGGEPLLQARNLGTLIARRPAWSWEIETNGTRPVPAWLPGNDMVQVNVSPKLSSSGVDEPTARIDFGWLTLAWQRLGQRLGHRRPVSFKFVVASEEDALEMASFLYDLKPPRRHVWVMPEGDRYDVARYEFVAQVALLHGVNFAARVHTLIWPGERAR